ncbi:MAG: type II secretion system protein M [Myxococcales bacterium]|nr:type II secretion system protein M [Myxococcales bacterium]MCB9709264.1 type II secretion system protein M [Myxococcales bacterium]
MDWNRIIEPIRDTWLGLSDRERRLAAILALVFGLLALFIPLLWAIQSSMQIADENEELETILTQIDASRDKLKERALASQAAQQRYLKRAPDLSAFLEEQGQQVGLTVSRAQPQPDLEIGSFVRRSVRVDLPNISLRPAIELMTAVENSEYPVAIEEIQLSHPQLGEDRFNLRLTVVAFDRQPSRNRSARDE